MIFVNYNKNIKIYQNPEEVAEKLAKLFKKKVNRSTADIFTVALAGGNTPKMFYKTLAQPDYSDHIDWNKVHFFWGDERCVPPDHEDSNYGMVKEVLFDKIDIPDQNIHRIKGELAPQEEVQNYAQEIGKYVEQQNNLPAFNIMLLGVGTDGHTASLFPNSMNLKENKLYCSVAMHPETEQKRITMNLKVIRNSRQTIFIVTGERKANIINKLLSDDVIDEKYPASLVNENNNNVIWFLDQDAGQSLNIDL